MAAVYPPSAASTARPYPSAPMATHNAPPGTFVPGTKVQVGGHRVIIERYLSEGGFAHVYVVKVPTASGGMETAVLKRVAVPDKENLANMRTEVETMKKLKGHRHIVTYIDSHASQLKAGGYEVFLLMEFCEGGGLIDFMNTRLKNRLTEPEILKIFSDACEGLATMHYLKPPLLHRDLKVENILIARSRSGGSSYYKLCDFGSTAPPRPAATSAAEGRLIEDDVQRHTTLQYRSPEMIDVYRNRPIDEKSDIWALGVLLYKLCYYTTPFEEQGQMAILTARFRYPAYPVFSDRLKAFVAIMLSEEPRKRPNIYQVLQEVCAMRGKQVPIKDIYANRTNSEARNNQQMPSSVPNITSPPLAGAVHESPMQTKWTVPQVTPMRRGRPAVTPRNPGDASPVSKINKDPFTALDSNSNAVRAPIVDKLASNLPALDDFSLLQDKGFNFKFGADLTASTPSETLALADEVFAPARNQDPALSAKPTPLTSRTATPEAFKSKSNKQSQPPVGQVSLEKPTSMRPAMVSTGTMPSRPSSPKEVVPPPVSRQPIWRVPITKDTLSVPMTNVIRQSDRQSQPRSTKGDLKTAISSRPSLEGLRSPSYDLSDPIHRSKSLDNRAKPIDKASSPGTFREQGSVTDSHRRPSYTDTDEVAIDDSNIESSTNYLRAMEDEGQFKSHNHRMHSMNRIKHASMPAISLSNTKNMFVGRIGEAFRRFEAGGTEMRPTSPSGSNQSDGPVLISEERGAHDLDGNAVAETEEEELSPEMRRELERRRLSLEERRVTEAAAAYRQRITASGNGSTSRAVGAPSRANAIQDRVKNLLDESGRQSPVKRTAAGYGKYTDDGNPQPPSAKSKPTPAPAVGRKPGMASLAPDASFGPPGVQVSAVQSRGGGIPGEVLRSKVRNSLGRPSAPPKPIALRKRAAGGQGTSGAAIQTSGEDTQADVVIDDLDSFSKRYPSLSLELVETEIASGQGVSSLSGLRIRDV